ncbi:MAG: branched-chain amino acid ABC transporter permease, partial [Dehalococcoidia bacterium]|nr:branched-chain amino acid ABC transporter permease [Dehalococcoidia bacterium]
MLAYSLGIACVSVAGVLLTNFFIIFPEVGVMFVLYALVAVTIGGFGSIQGALVGGLIIGLIESIGGFVGIPALKQALVFAVFVIVVVLRPQGLFGWAD